MRHMVFALLLLFTRAALASCPAPVLLQGPSLPAATNPQGIAIADFDKDGNLDYAVPGIEGIIAVYRGNGDGTFAAVHSYNITGDHPVPVFLITADFNSDTYPDLAAVDQSANQLLILTNAGDGTFTIVKRDAGTTGIKSLHAGDFNGDGKADLVAAGQYFSVLFGAGNGTFSPAPTFTGPWADPVDATAADVNHDGVDEIATLVKDGFGTHSAIVVYSRVSSTFTPQVIANIADDWDDAIYAADLNGDGWVDLVTVHYSQKVLVLLNNGAGGFQAPVTYTLDQVPQAVVAFDLDQDGDRDLVFGAINATPSLVPVMLGNGDGTFQPPFVRPISMPGVWTLQIYSLGYGDINNDGRPDILLLDAANDAVHVMKNYCPDKPTSTTLTQMSETSLFNEYVGLTVTVAFEDGSTPAGRVFWFDNGRYTGVSELRPDDPGMLHAANQALQPGEHVLTARFEGTAEYAPSEGSVNHTVFRVPFGPPQIFRADGNNGGAAYLTWVKTDDSHHFEISRMEDGGWSVIGTTEDQFYWDPDVSAAKGYFYRVRAFRTGDGAASAYTPADAALGQTADPAPGDVISAKDLEKLRDGVDKIRIAAGLPAANWTDRGIFGQSIKKTHMVELQTGLNEAISAAGGIPWTYAPITAGVTAVKAADFRLIASFMW